MQREQSGRPFLVREIRVTGYRSLRSIRVSTGQLTVFVGANGVGKTNLYRTLQLLQAAATGSFSQHLALEGGMASALWAGPRRSGQPTGITLCAGFGEAACDLDRDGITYSYEIIAGLTPPTVPDAFPHEPQIKEETLYFHHRERLVKLLERRGFAAFGRDREGRRSDLVHSLMASETALSSFADPQRFPELHSVRQAMLDWRFYDGLRTDAAAPVRHPYPAVTSPTLASNGSNLAAVLATLVYIRKDSTQLDEAIQRAFPGATLFIPPPERKASFGMIFPDHPQRVFEAAELSDGTLRYLQLVGALLSLRLPAFIALNEPESSLHPSLLEPLAELVAAAAKRTQVWLVTHSEPLANALAYHSGVQPKTVVKEDGETCVGGPNSVHRHDD